MSGMAHRMMDSKTNCEISLEPSPEIVQPEVQPLKSEVTVDEEVATDVVSEVSSVEAAEATESKEAEETKKVKVSGTKMEVAPMKPEVTAVEQVKEEVKEEAPKGKAGDSVFELPKCVGVDLPDDDVVVLY